MFRTLLNVVDALPEDIENSCSEDVEFLVEGKRVHSEDVNRLIAARDSLQQQKDKLAELDVKFAEMTDAIDGALTATVEESSSAQGAGEAKKINSRYETLLQNMEKHCDTLIRETNSIATIASSSSSSHQQLYEAYQKVIETY